LNKISFLVFVSSYPSSPSSSVCTSHTSSTLSSSPPPPIHPPKSLSLLFCLIFCSFPLFYSVTEPSFLFHVFFILSPFSFFICVLSHSSSPYYLPSFPSLPPYLPFLFLILYIFLLFYPLTFLSSLPAPSLLAYFPYCEKQKKACERFSVFRTSLSPQNSKAGIVEQQETDIIRQRFGKHVPAATNT
jgi:hypothetical protein